MIIQKHAVHPWAKNKMCAVGVHWMQWRHLLESLPEAIDRPGAPKGMRGGGGGIVEAGSREAGGQVRFELFKGLKIPGGMAMPMAMARTHLLMVLYEKLAGLELLGVHHIQQLPPRSV